MNSISPLPLPTEPHTKALAQAIAAVLRPVDCLTLSGTLGAGKTTFMRYLLQALGHEGAVVSPSFMLVQAYDLSIGTLYHMDAYRIEDASECEEVGLGEMLEQGIVCIEWPEICADWLPKDALNLKIDLENNERSVALSGHHREQAIEQIRGKMHEFRA